MTPTPDQPSQMEPVPVQLTRMEGTINLIAYQFGEVKEDIKEIRGDVTGIGGRTANLEQTAATKADMAEVLARVQTVELVQASNAGASSTWKTWLPTILTAIAALAALGLGIHFGG